jgi:hypothetical protein
VAGGQQRGEGLDHNAELPADDGQWV